MGRFLFRRSAHVVISFNDPKQPGATLVHKHFILCSYQLFLDHPRTPTNGTVKPHFSAIQCFLDIPTNQSTPPTAQLGGLPSTIPPEEFALIGILGELSNFPHTGRYLKHVFRLHALGDTPGGDRRGYEFAYNRFREYA